MINVVMYFILNCNVFNQNSVNDVIMLVWSPSVELNAKAELVKGYACMMYIFLFGPYGWLIMPIQNICKYYVGK